MGLHVGGVNIEFGATLPRRKSPAAEPRPYHHGDLRQALIDAALVLVTEEQNWSFSLREVARRAGVSHNAPYNHFPEKRDLLGAVAAVGFEMLRGRMLKAIAKIRAADRELTAVAQAYVGFAVENPALFRLLFGPALVGGDGTRPDLAQTAGAEAKAVLEGILLRGTRSGLFAVALEDQVALEMATVSCRSAVHGLAMLVIDAKAETALPLRKLVHGLMWYLLNGLRKR
jgi:AcrR family transcriptional regulator